jgi:hypothetical protein
VLVAFIVLSASMFFLLNRDEGDSEQTMETEYSIEITSPDDENYTLILPIPVDGNGNPEPVVQDIQVVKGNGTFSVVHESYGWVMIIEGKKDLIIRGDRHYFTEPAVPSMVNSSGPPIQNPLFSWGSEIPGYWNTTIYSSKNNLYLRVEYSLSRYSSYPSVEGVGWETSTWKENEIERGTIKIENPGWTELTFAGLMYRSEC